MKSFNQSQLYRSFVNERDDALEKILINTQLKITEHTNETFIRVLDIIRSRYDMLHGGGFRKTPSDRMKFIEFELDNAFHLLMNRVKKEITLMRKKVALLTISSENHIIGAVLTRPIKLNLMRHDIDQISKKPMYDNTSIDNKLNFIFKRLIRKIMDDIEYCSLMDYSMSVALGRVYKLLPKYKSISKKTYLKLVRDFKEAGVGVNVSFSGKSKDFQIDPETWDMIFDDYKKRYIPNDRSPTSVFDIKDPFSDRPLPESEIPKEDRIYGWQVEQEVTHDFIKEVRDGQNDAANKNGIDEFMWLAIIDDKTCEKCCLWRDGLLTSEIEDKLGKNQELKEECDAITSPAHFNCRCVMVPTTKDLEMMDISKEEKDFDQWLNS